MDGTFELFRAYYALPSSRAPDGREVAATRGLVQTLLALLRQPEVTHLACAFDHPIESFRNRMLAGYKSGEGVPPGLAAQFDLAERAASALGLVVWPMDEFEADDAIATAVRIWSAHHAVEQVVVCSPDKDLMQLVRGDRVVCLDRRKDQVFDEAAVVAKMGVPPESIPDYLALVGDAADGIPGISGWGAKSTARVLSEYRHIESIPDNASDWAVSLRGAQALAQGLARRRDDARLYKSLATLRLDVPLAETLEDLKWRGVRRAPYQAMCAELGFERLAGLPHRWHERD